MSPPPPPPPPPPLNLRTTAQVIKHSSTTFLSHISTFLFLSLLLFSFRTTVQNGTFFLTTFIDQDPSLKSLLSRLDLAGKHLNSPQNPPSQPTNHHRRRRPFLRLSHVGTLDDDFFSTDHDRTLFNPLRNPHTNATSIFLNQFVDSEKNVGIRFPGMISSEFVFKTEEEEEEEELSLSHSHSHSQDLPAKEIQFLIRGLEIGGRDAAALLFLVSFLSTVYGWVILGFLVTNSCILGVVFFVVVTNCLQKHNPGLRAVWAGSKLGVKRLSGVILMRWAVRDAMTQVLGLWFFGEIEDQHSFFKLFVSLKLMPFSVTSPWIHGYELEISRFLITWVLSDTVVALVFAVDSWVAIMDVRSGREILKEGVYLISTMLHQAIQLKGFEAILCGDLVKWVLTRIFGNLFAMFVQSVVEVYFMVVWLIYYFAVRCKDASSDGREFGRRDLEDYIDGLK